MACGRDATIHVVVRADWQMLVCETHSIIRVEGEPPKLVHKMVPACGMPGSIIDFDSNTCIDPFPELDPDTLKNAKDGELAGV